MKKLYITIFTLSMVTFITNFFLSTTVDPIQTTPITKKKEKPSTDRISLKSSAISKMNSNETPFALPPNLDDEILELLEACNNDFLDKCSSLFDKLWEQQEYKIGYQILKNKCNINELSKNICLQVGHLARKLKLKEDSLKYYKSSCNNEVDDACMWAGIIERELGRNELAKEVLQKSCTSGDDASCGWLAFVENELGNPYMAEKYAIKLCSKKYFNYACHLMGHVNIKRGDDDTAYPYFKKACTDGYIWSCQGQAHIENKRGNIDRALSLYKKSCKENIFSSCLKAAYIEQTRGNEKRANQLLKKSCRKHDHKTIPICAAYLKRHSKGVNY